MSDLRIAHFQVENPFSVDEVEFQAEDELISIIPKFTHDSFHFISGTFGPFVPGMSVEVPLWFAVTLRKRQHCQIVPPPWLGLEALRTVLDREQTDHDNFQGGEDLPYHYIEISSLMFDVAADDIKEGDRVRTTLEDIQNVRMAKIRRGIQLLAKLVNEEEQRIKSVNLTNIAAMEIFQIRPFLTGTLNKFYKMARMPSESTDRGVASSAPRRFDTSSASSSSSGGGSGAAAAAAEKEEGGEGGGSTDQAPTSTRKLRRFR